LSTYRLQVHASVNEIAAADWDRLRDDDQPFATHAFLAGLEETRSLRADFGWTPFPLTLHLDDRIVGAAPAYLKTNSHGEFVFDWAWARAYEQHGLRYYPKLLVGVPYTPVCGQRLLVGAGAAAPAHRRALVQGLLQLLDQQQLSSAHINFLTETDAASFAHDPWLPRGDLQFHWHNAGYRDFADFLDRFNSKKRKNLRAERSQVAAAGVEFRWIHGDQMPDALWPQIHALYCGTFEEKGNTPALTEGFFRHLGQTLGAGLLAITAWRGGELFAMALCLRDRHALYGRYWGCREPLPGLHFETCYYQGIEYCLNEGLQRFEPGAQGEHKLARGFLPVRTRSMHHLRHPDFRRAVRQALDQERTAMRNYERELWCHTPFKG
jgi:hypothetical protein